MKTGFAVLFAALALLFLAVAAPVLLVGPRQPEPVAAAAMLAGEAPWRDARDLAVAGIVVRGGGLDAQRLHGYYYLPLVDDQAADAADRAGSTWKVERLREAGRVAIARLALDDVPASGLPWDETVTRPGSVGAFVASGAVREAKAFDGVTDLLWERFGLRPDQVVVVDHGVPYFGRVPAATLAAIGLLLGWFAFRTMRARRRDRAAERAATAAGGPPGRMGRGVWGGIAAALVAVLALGGRLFSSAVRALDSHVDDAASLVRAADGAPTGERVLEAVKTAKDLSPFVQFAREMVGAGAARLALHDGLEVYQREDDGAYHLTAATVTIELQPGRGVPHRSAQSVAPDRAAGEDTRVTFQRRATGEVFARLAHAEGQAVELPLRFVVGGWADLGSGGRAELVCDGDGARRLAEFAAGDLRAKLPAGASVAVESARTPRLAVTDRVLLVDTGESVFTIRSGVR